MKPNWNKSFSRCVAANYLFATFTPKGEETAPSTVLEITTHISQGVIVECFRSGSKLQVRVVLPGYNPNWNKCDF